MFFVLRVKLLINRLVCPMAVSKTADAFQPQQLLQQPHRQQKVSISNRNSTRECIFQNYFRSQLDPFVGCEWCLNDKLSVGDTSAGYCYPNPSESECNCLCADLFCQNGQIIDRSTCVNGGSMANCKCIDTSTPMPTPATIGFR